MTGIHMCLHVACFQRQRDAMGEESTSTRCVFPNQTVLSRRFLRCGTCPQPAWAELRTDYRDRTVSIDFAVETFNQGFSHTRRPGPLGVHPAPFR